MYVSYWGMFWIGVLTVFALASIALIIYGITHYKK